VASRPSSTSGSARGDAREPAVARVVTFTPAERVAAPAANDNQRSTARRLLNALGAAVAVALAAGGGLYLYLI
jgi:hypothetical protein